MQWWRSWTCGSSNQPMGRKDGWRIAHDAEGVAVRFLLRREFDAATGAAGPGRSGVSLSGGRAGTGSQNAERVFAAASAGDQRRVHAGGADGATGGAGEVGAGGDGLDASAGERLAAQRGGLGTGATRAVGTGSAAGAVVPAEGEPARSGGRRRREPEPGATTGAGRAARSGAAQEGTSPGFVDRSGQPLPAYGAGLGVGLDGGSGRQRRSPDRGHAGDAERDRQRLAGADGRGGGATCGARPEKVTGDSGFF